MTLPSVVLASLAAPQLSSYIPVKILEMYIALFLVSVSIYQLAIKKSIDDKPLIHNDFYLVAASFVCTLLSGLAGVALGILMIPMLSRYLSHLQAVGTSIVLALIYAIVSSAGYMVAGLRSDHASLSSSLSDYTLGYIYLPAFVFIALTIAVFPFVGEKLARYLSPKVIEKLFYSFLLVAGLSILYRALS